MKKSQLFLAFISLTFSFLQGCISEEQKRFNAYLAEGERLKKVYCSTCHLESSQELLDQKTWVYKVLPQMGPCLGMHSYKELHSTYQSYVGTSATCYDTATVE